MRVANVGGERVPTGQRVIVENRFLDLVRGRLTAEAPLALA
jgi:hypothetical protein